MPKWIWFLRIYQFIQFLSSNDNPFGPQSCCFRILTVFGMKIYSNRLYENCKQYKKNNASTCMQPIRLFTNRLFTATLHPLLDYTEKRPCCFLKKHYPPNQHDYTHTRFVIVLTISVFLKENLKLDAINKTNNPKPALEI